MVCVHKLFIFVKATLFVISCMNNLTQTSLILIALLYGHMLSMTAKTSIEMNHLNVKKVHAAALKAAEVPALMDKENVTFHPINTINWEAFPYRPEVAFRIAYTNEALLLHYKVKEKSVRARYQTDNDPVYKDSCVEFFFSPADDNIYYNIECNCIGAILLGCGAPGNRERVTPETIALVQRWSSFGNQPFEEQPRETEWEVALIIPYAVFYKHQSFSPEGKTLKANFYKCGDELATPHFVSWNPIYAEKPNFHLPAYFGTLIFE